MTIKPSNQGACREIIYNETRWTHLGMLRKKAAHIMVALEMFHIHSTVHGSTARGDVKIDSDIDIFIDEIQNSFLVETALKKANITLGSRWIMQATPNNAMKAHIEIDDQTTLSFPLMEMHRVQREFYRFGGEATLCEVETGKRAVGADKRLMLIEPTKKGHVESSIVGREEATAKILGITSQTVLNRVHTLLRRDAIGRTGMFIKKEIEPQETFELAMKKLVEANPAVRRRIRG